MPKGHITGAPSCDLLPLADDAECHQLYIPPRHRTWDLLLLIVCWLDQHSVVWVSTPLCTGSTVHFRQQPLLRGPPVERARPHYIPFRVLPWSQPNLAQRSGAPGNVRYLRTVYREYAINALVELEQKLCSCNS